MKAAEIVEKATILLVIHQKQEFAISAKKIWGSLCLTKVKKIGL